MKTYKLNGFNFTQRSTKLDGKHVGFGYAIDIPDEQCLETLAEMVDAGVITNKQINSWITSGCAVAMQSNVRNANTAKWSDKLIGTYFPRVDHSGTYAEIVPCCKTLWSSELDNGENPIVHYAPWGKIDDPDNVDPDPIDDGKDGDIDE